MLFSLKVYSESEGIGQIQVEAPGIREAEASVANRGYMVLHIAPLLPSSGYAPWRRARAFPLLHFSQQLHGLLRAGLSLVEAIETLAEKEPAQEIRTVLGTLVERLRQGQSLSSALAADPDSFPPFYVASLKASEQSGDVAESLRRYIAYQKQIEGLKKQVVSALIYPALLLVVGALVTLFLLAYVVPKFSRIYESRSDSLPLMSRLLMDWGAMVSHHPWLLATGLALLLGSMVWFLSRPALRQMLADRAWRLPWLGERLRTYQLSRLFRTLGMLLHGGTPMSSALAMVPGLLQLPLRAPLASAMTRIREGESISLAFQGTGLTTAVAYRMLRVGERSGQMADMMENIATFYDEEIERDIGIFTRIFEPVMMALIGILVGGIVIIMYMPIFDLAGSLQ